MERSRFCLVSAALGFVLAACTICSLTAASADEVVRSELAQRRVEIAHHDELYFKKAAPEISDAAYDQLKRELAALELAHPDLTPAREGVGDDRSGRFPTAVHR